MEAEAPASAGSFREESAALGVGMGGGGSARWGGRCQGGEEGLVHDEHWRLNCFCAFTVSGLRCLSHGSGGLKNCPAAQRARVVSNGPQNPSPPILLRQEILL